MSRIIVGPNIVKAREAKGLTREELHALIQQHRPVDYSHLWRCENGRRTPSLGLAVDIARALELPLDALVTYEQREN